VVVVSFAEYFQQVEAGKGLGDLGGVSASDSG